VQDRAFYVDFASAPAVATASTTSFTIAATTYRVSTGPIKAVILSFSKLSR
tara:strand:- start:312 stop:464 length:153 start_codon:yes stop_codon:yes gene_type:complete